MKTIAVLTCATTIPKRRQESQRSRQKSCKPQSTDSKKGKSPDSDGIRAEDIKACDDETIETVRQIFNIIKRNEFTPKDWEKVTIKVIHKKGDVKNVSNYRPICSLLALYKLFSTILYGRLYPVLDHKQAEDEAGFRKSYQTTDHLATYRIIEQRCHEWWIEMWTATVKFTKALDSITHKSIWDALKYCNIEHGCISLLKKIYGGPGEHLYRLTKRVTFSRSEKEPSKVTRCQACCLTRFSNTHWRTICFDGKRKKEWAYTWAITTVTASLTRDLQTTCYCLLPLKNRYGKCCVNSRKVQKKVGLRIHPEKTKILSNQSIINSDT